MQTGAAATGLGVLAGCMGLFGGGGTTTLRANSPAAEGSVHGDAAAWLGEYVSEETGGSIEIDAYRNSELGGQIESIENVSSGSLDMYVIPYALTGTQYQPAQVFDAPYLYDPDNPYEDIYEKTDPQDSEIAQQVIDDLVSETDIRSLGAVVQGTRRVTLNVNNEPPRNPEELSEYTMRAVPIAMYSEALKALGAQTTNIDFSEVPQALATGSIQGQENPYNIIRSSGIWENQNYILETNHMHSPLAVIMNEGVFQDLSESEQQVLYDGVREIQPRATETLESNLEGHKSFMRDNGLTIVPPEDLEMDAFRSAARSRIRSQFPDLIGTIEQLHGDGYPA
ncbi:TRAP transporter substrate-binding protein [Halobacterium litoreum]|uniref:TRAP transporter substrate-binding protein n=1 Tax=Halobacterium litoreum TaxID=2039234 RepID=A0ABD5NGA0_9EURY|nr:TRAP transporter substrate-binding protein [Halobacterium litoreum]UHH12907.1 TRAP transporter substrate-binding protein [Halobacterium litoreum]